MNLSSESLARISATHPWRMLLVWLVVLSAAFGLIFTLVEEALGGEDGPTQVLEYEQAQILINERTQSDGEQGVSLTPGTTERSTQTEFVVVNSESVAVGDPAFDEHLDAFGEALDEIASELIVGSFSDYESMPSQDGTTTLIQLQIFTEAQGDIGRLLETAEEFSRDGFRVLVAGNASVTQVFEELAEQDLLVGESIGIGVALIILALVFGAVVAAFIPIVMAIVAIVTAIGISGLVGQIMELNQFVPNIITMMGLAVGIDYSLFVVSRYREERAKGLEQTDAIARSGGTASRAVFFSGLTVVLALLGMLILPERTFQAFGVAAILVVFVAVFACLTLLPAVIGILGDRVNGVRVPAIATLVLFGAGVAAIPDRTQAGRILLVAAIVILVLILVAVGRKLMRIRRPQTADAEAPARDQRGFWVATTNVVMRRPYVSMAMALVILVGLIFPFFDLRLGTTGISALPDEVPSRQAFELLNEKYGFGSDSPALVVIDGDVDAPNIAAAISDLTSAMEDDPTLGAPEVEIHADTNIAILSATVPGDPTTQDAQATIRRLREEHIPDAFAGVSADEYTALVGGATAEVVDLVGITLDYSPIVFAAVLGLSFILLLVAFRSVVIPLASIVMNLLSVGAAYGLLVLVFQKGFLIELFDFQPVDQVEFWLPLFMFTILFGLSMDYQVFMLSRIKERYDETGDHPGSVAFGLSNTGRIITGAALIMAAVFGGFALGQITFFESLGFGLGAAIILDATIVRSLLVPSVLRILGTRTWYFPAMLRWIPNISIEGQRPPQ